MLTRMNSSIFLKVRMHSNAVKLYWLKEIEGKYYKKDLDVHIFAMIPISRAFLPCVVTSEKRGKFELIVKSCTSKLLLHVLSE